MSEPPATSTDRYGIRPIGLVHSSLADPAVAPKQGHEGAPDAQVEIFPEFVAALRGLKVGEDLLLLTWLHRADRSTLEVHPRDDPGRPLAGVFSTRSAARPNPVGLHRVRLLAISDERWLHVSALEAIDGTPVVDIKPVVIGSARRLTSAAALPPDPRGGRS